MKPVKGYKEASAVSYDKAERLPVGGYVLRILDVKEETSGYGDVIILRFDIAEGEQKGFFDKQYKAMSDEYKKWKGTYRLNVPSMNGSGEDAEKKYKRALGFFKAQIEAFNKSNGINIDCSCEWDSAVLKGRLIGAVFGNKEYDYNGRRGWFTNCDRLIPVEDIRSGNFTVPKDRPLKDSSSAPNNTSEEFEEIGGEEPVPF